MADEPRMISVKDAMELMASGKYTAAVDLCDEILELMPENATAICVRERCRWLRGDDPQSCIDSMQEAFRLAPESAVVRNYLATILISTGQNDQASRILSEALEASPGSITAFFELAEITRFTEETELLRQMKRLHESGTLIDAQMEALGFALAKAYSDLKDAPQAMHFVTSANLNAHREFDIEKVARERADLEKYAELTGKVETSDPADVPDHDPIFIVGMPRSGTTLVETIISRHAGVFPAGELMVMPVVEGQVRKWLKEDRGISAGKHTMLPHVPDNVWQQNAEQIGKIVRQKSDAPFRTFTDKLPANTHRLVMISKLFPNARIIYVRRHPLDCCLSNYFKRFGNLDFTFRQDWLGTVYRDMSEFVAISRQLIANPVLDLSYERLIADPETETRRLVDFVGLDWDEGFLTPEKSDRRTVMTASRWQVRQPIYKSSSARWKPYEPYLGELIAALGGMEWIEAQVAETDAAASV